MRYFRGYPRFHNTIEASSSLPRRNTPEERAQTQRLYRHRRRCRRDSAKPGRAIRHVKLYTAACHSPSLPPAVTHERETTTARQRIYHRRTRVGTPSRSRVEVARINYRESTAINIRPGIGDFRLVRRSGIPAQR